jgi:UDP-glucose 4-epimerase
MKILVTGGAGYIGTHTCVELLGAGFNVVVVDNFCNSNPKALDRVEKIAGRKLDRMEGDVRDADFLKRVFAAHTIDAVIHFAGLKAVGESVEQPLRYFDNNVTGSLRLLQAMEAARVRRFVFSSSATVYGVPDRLPIDEKAEIKAASSPYGNSKIVVERMMEDVARQKSEKPWNMMSLRYFNPAGAHESGLIGEDPRDIPNNLMPFVAKVAVGKLPYVHVFGNDYDTPDGTGVRDYIHVVDLAKGHVAALNYLVSNEKELVAAKAMSVVNLGTGRGYSVLDVVKAFGAACGRELPYRIEPRRSGDIASCYADPALAEKLFGWRAERGLEAMCADSWRWQSQNPNGYQD